MNKEICKCGHKRTSHSTTGKEKKGYCYIKGCPCKGYEFKKGGIEKKHEKTIL